MVIQIVVDIIQVVMVVTLNLGHLSLLVEAVVEVSSVQMVKIAVGWRVMLEAPEGVDHSGIGHRVVREFLAKDLVVDHRQSAMDPMVNIG